MSDERLIALYVFGSAGRGQEDHLSDLDILAIVRDNAGTVPTEIVLSLIPAPYRELEPSISWYGADRIRSMFENGELFAWHLHTEALPLREGDNFLAALGKPSRYYDGPSDVKSFLEIAGNIGPQVKANPQNAVYEAGLIYVCLRNSAMAASAILSELPDFSRNSPFNLGASAPGCPVSRDEYIGLMRCRMAGQRGIDAPSVSVEAVVDMAERSCEWLGELEAVLRKLAQNG